MKITYLYSRIEKIFEASGEAKKALMQVEALKKLGVEADIYIHDQCIPLYKLRIRLPNYIAYSQQFRVKLIEHLVTKKIDAVYIRKHLIDASFLKLAKEIKGKGIKVIYEIPTYPYFAEMYRMAKKKYRALIKIMLDVIYNPIIFHYAERILIVKSNSQKRIHKKMVEMCNGLNVDDVESKVYATPKALNELNLVAVGTIYPYHGYDRLIEGMRLCNEKIDGIDLKLHFIGASETMNKLEELSKKYQLKHVFFYGEKTTKELNEMYKDFDIGVGCLGLHRKNADIDTSLKVIEYYCRGVPVISSAQCLEERYTLFVSADDSPINMKEVVDFYRGVVDSNEYKDLSVKSKLKYSWEAVLGKALM